MKTAGWLATKSPAPPADLSVAVSSAMSDGGTGGNPSPADFVAASRIVLAKVLNGECESRSGALDLLTFDSLITYAMEGATGSPSDCEAAATAILSLIGDAAAAV